LLIAAAAWLAFTPGKRDEPTILLLTALCTTFVVDVLYTYLPLVNTFDVARLDLFYPLAYLMIAGAAIHPESAELTTAGATTHHMHPARIVLLGVALATVPAVAITTDTAGLTTRIVLLVLSLLLSLAVVARFALAV